MRHTILVLLSLLMFLCTPLCAQNIYLLSVGISDYEGSSNDLRLPVNDARAVSALYSKNGSATVEMLLDSDATGENIKKKMASLFSKAGKNDIVVLFFSGHGSHNGIAAYDGIVSYESIRKLLSRCKSINKMVFIDSCFSGEIRVSGHSNRASKTQNVMFFLSSRSNEKSIEGAAMKNGLFTAFLERGLRGGADSDRNRTVTAKELYNFVSKGVKEASYDKQHPVMWGNFSNNMPVIKW